MDKKSVKVLIVEEDPIQRDLITMAIKRQNCEAITASKAGEAVDLFLAERPQVMFIDIFLSQRNGLELLKTLKKLPVFQGTRVVMISGLGFPEVVKRAIELGADDFMVKPIDIDVLTERFQILLSKIRT